MFWHPLFSFTSRVVAPVPSVTVQSGGGGTLHLPTGRRRSKEELRAERERLGILPLEPVILKTKPRALPKVIEAELDRELGERIRQTEDELVLVLLMH